MKRMVLTRNGMRPRNLCRRRAIRQHCAMCCDFHWPDVLECTRRDCPLHAYRKRTPRAPESLPGRRAASIGRFCLTCSGGSVAQKTACCAEECALHPYRDGGFPSAR